MTKTRICVMVSGGGTNLQALIDAWKKGNIPNGELALVISNKKDAYALTRASSADIPIETVLKQECGTAELFEEKIIELLKEYHIDLIVLAGFMAILSKSFTARYPERIINVHPSLIPAFCGKGFYGLKVHEAALAYGVKVTGATVHFVNEVPDGGKIILQKAVTVRENETPESLQKRVMRLAEWKILPQAVSLVSNQIAMTK